MKILTKLVIAAALVALGAIGFAYSGLYDVRASSPHSGLVNWLFSTASRASIERQADDVSVPDLSDTALAKAGVNDFDTMCVGCHGAPGKNPEAMGQGLNPPPPDLVESAAHMNPAELFWVTKYGIKMTGMPAWGATHGDDALWPVVAFMTTLPDLDADGYQALLASATGMGHHADDSDVGDTTLAAGGDNHEHADVAPATPDHHDAPDAPPHDHDEPTPESEEVPHEDGHDHEH
jgi:mono/diheme cytochrome c family protein